MRCRRRFVSRKSHFINSAVQSIKPAKPRGKERNRIGNVAQGEKIKELAVGPDFTEAELEEAVRRLNAEGGGADRERDIGMHDGSHGYRKNSARVESTVKGIRDGAEGNQGGVGSCSSWRRSRFSICCIRALRLKR